MEEEILGWFEVKHIGIGVELALIVFAIFFLDFGLRRGFKYLRETKADNVLFRSLDRSLMLPVSVMIWGYGAFVGIDLLERNYDFFVTENRLEQARQIFLIIGLTWFLFGWKKRVEEVLLQRIQKRRPKDRAKQALVGAVGKLLSIFFVGIAGLMILDVLEVPLQALIALGGINALAISFAAKDIIANFFGGLMLYINQPFVAGDWIKSPNKNFEGVVEHIGWYMTRVRTFERVPMFLPNALITDAIVENPGRMYNRRIRADIGVRYDDVKQVDGITKEIEKMLKEHPEIDQKQTLMVHFLEFGPFSLNINIYTFTKTTDWQMYREIHQDVLLKVSDIITSKGAQIAFPTQTLHLHSEKT